MTTFDWIAEFGEPGPHVPYSVAPNSFDHVDSESLRIRAEIQTCGLCESPIEIILGAEITRAFFAAGIALDFIHSPNKSWRIVPQFSWSFYRSDWAIVNPTGAVMLIECDGRDFHSSAEQLAHDRRKDETAAARGYRTYRFSGSEIHSDARTCAQRILRQAQNL